MIQKYHIILASNSPRRKELLSGLDLEYEVNIIPNIDESYPSDIPTDDVPEYIANKKAEAYKPFLKDGTLLITADTVVVLEDKIYGKPIDEADAKKMLHDLSGKTHRVITGVCLTTKDKQRRFSAVSDVRFSTLTNEEIEYYVTKYKPLDKAGAYGVQEWIGHVAVEFISGSYYNIMGLPIQRLYQELKKIAQ